MSSSGFQADSYFLFCYISIGGGSRRSSHLRFTTRSRSIILAPSPTALTSSTGKRFLRLASAGSELKTRRKITSLFWILGFFLLEKRKASLNKIPNKNANLNFKLQQQQLPTKRIQQQKPCRFKGTLSKHPLAGSRVFEFRLGFLLRLNGVGFQGPSKNCFFCFFLRGWVEGC